MSISPRFVQVSILTSYPAVLLNRDDSGLAKRVPFGGYTRTRVSSQCIKRHLRTCEDPYGLDKIADDLELSVRSRKIFSLRISPVLEREGFSKEIIEEVLHGFQKKLYGGKEKEDASRSIDREEVIVLGEPEIRFIIENAKRICADCDSVKAAKPKTEEYLKIHQKDFQALKYGAGIDAALFGRFVSGDPDSRVPSAIHVAHSITVHEETFETDYFTAVDDLVELGSGHINSSELTSGLFYSYMVVDVPQLVANLGCGMSKNWLAKEIDRTIPAKAVEHLIHLFATASPGAKLGSTAPYAYADLALVEMGERQPRNLANAFLNPVRMDKGDILTHSINALTDFVSSWEEMYGKHEKRLLSCRFDSPVAPRMPLPELAEEVRKNIEVGSCG